jgi:hypothetical protein
MIPVISNIKHAVTAAAMARRFMLTTRELSRAGPATQPDFRLFDKTRRPTGDGSGKVVRHGHLF